MQWLTVLRLELSCADSCVGWIKQEWKHGVTEELVQDSAHQSVVSPELL